MKKHLVKHTGFSPEIIGEVVSIKLFRFKNGVAHEDTLEKSVGILEGYYVSARSGGSFKLKGYHLTQFDTNRNKIEVFVLEEVA